MATQEGKDLAARINALEARVAALELPAAKPMPWRERSAKAEKPVEETA